MILFRFVAAVAFVFGVGVFFLPEPMATQLCLAGVYWLITTVAMVGDFILVALERPAG